MNMRPLVLTSKEFFEKEFADRADSAIGYKPGQVEQKNSVDDVFRLIHDGAPDEVEYRRERIKAAGDNPDQPKLLLPYTISTEARDRDGDRIMVRGWRLKLYRETNPIVLFNHNASQLPIGRSARVWQHSREGEPSRLRAVAQFMSREFDGGFSETVFRMAKGGYLPASSVGFMPRKYEKDPLVEEMSDEERKQIPYYGGWVHKETELLEWSPVMIPSNPFALNEARSAGIDVSPWVTEAEKALAGEESKIRGWMRDEVCELFGLNKQEERTSTSLSTRGLLEQSILTTKTSKTFVQNEGRNPYEGVDTRDHDGNGEAPSRNPIHEGKSALQLAEELAENAQETLKALNIAAEGILAQEKAALADLEKAAEIIQSTLAAARDEEAEPETPAGPVEERSATTEPDPEVKAFSFLSGLLSTGS